jgi:hypothetical protein
MAGGASRGVRAAVRDYLAAQVQSARTPLAGRQVAREYIQARILASLQRQGAMVPLAFHGGTALRFLYQAPRFSEDLDFALERPERGYDFRRYLQAIRSELVSEGYTTELRVSDRKTVHGAFVRLPGRLTDARWDAVRRDVEPLLDPSVDPALVSRDTVLEVLARP